MIALDQDLSLTQSRDMLGNSTIGAALRMTFRLQPLLLSHFAILLLAVSVPTNLQAFAGCSVKPTSSLVVNVRDRGAKGDGKTDDTAAIQRAIDEIAGTGGTVYIPDGTFMVQGTGKTLRLGSKMTLKLADRAVLKVIPTAAPQYTTLRIVKATDVTVIGGTLHGDRKEHKGKKGEWGMGIHIGSEAARVAIVGVTSRNMLGDGFYVSGVVDVALCSVSAINNRRQGLSIIEANRVLVTNSLFRDTHGTRPSAGIDMEPNKPDQSITNVRIEHSKFINNAGDGILIASKKGRVANVEIRGNLFDGNDQPILVENAPGVRSTAICGNRLVARQEKPKQNLNAYAEPVQVVAPQIDCHEGSDMRFEKSRFTKKKRPKAGN